MSQPGGSGTRTVLSHFACHSTTARAARSIHLTDGVTAMAALATLPEARGRGVGVAVLKRMIQDARSEGSRVIFWTVVPGSYAAGMYSRLGFVTLFQTRSFAAVSA